MDQITVQSLIDKVEQRTVAVGIIGLGYVGLPLVRAFHRSGVRVTGLDTDESKIESLRAGRSYIDTLSSSDVAVLASSSRFTMTTDFEALGDLDAIIICVPTPLTATREPDLSYVRASVEVVAKHLRSGHLVILESTTYPGTTDEVVKPILEKSGLVEGEDFYLAFSPEREDPGNREYSTTTIPKLVGGVSEASGRLASALYELAVDTVVPVSSAKVAEAAKILENVYRSVNIALVNELKILFDHMNIDIWEVIAAAATKPFGYQPFYPGPGLGGHCIPIDPFYLTWKARQYGLVTRFIELAGEINTHMPDWVIRTIARALNEKRKTVNGSRGLIVGLAYKKNTDDCRESPSFVIMEKLLELGARLVAHDPHVLEMPKKRNFDLDVELSALTPEVLESRDYALIVTDHDEIDWEMVVRHSSLVIDTRNATAGVTEGRDKIVMS